MITVEFLHKGHPWGCEERPLRTGCFHNEMESNVAFSEGLDIFILCFCGKCPLKKKNNERSLKQFVKLSPLALEVVCLSESPRSIISRCRVITLAARTA